MKDAQEWPGLTRREAVVERLRPELHVFHAERGARSRIVAEAARGRITVDGREIVGTVLVDGFAGGT